MMKVSVVCLLFLWSVVELVHCQQTFPYISFMGQTLAGHSYVDISQVGNDFTGGSNTVQCHTDLMTCCTNSQGPHRGDWYFPNGTRLEFPDGKIPIVEARQDQRVDLRRINNHNEPTGIYRFSIPTVALHHATDKSVRASVYVGLYTSTGGRLQCCGANTEGPYCYFNVGDIRLHLTLTNWPSPVSPLVDLLPLSLGPETPLPLSLQGLRVY